MDNNEKLIKVTQKLNKRRRKKREKRDNFTNKTKEANKSDIERKKISVKNNNDKSRGKNTVITLSHCVFN